MILEAVGWKDYELIDSGNLEKLERWNDILISRPDPQAIWDKQKSFEKVWSEANFKYIRSKSGGGFWVDNSGKQIEPESLPSSIINWKGFSFNFRLTQFKHTQLFPEQSANWEKIISFKPKNLLNLFAYTGAASVVALSTGSKVTHVDSSSGMINIASKNVVASGQNTKNIRFLKDDVIKFISRENRRGNKYDSIILDPPSYGRGSNGELWQIEKSLPQLLRDINTLLSADKKFVMLNVYANEYSNISFANLCRQIFGVDVQVYELGIRQASNNFILPAGSTILMKF